MMVVFSLAMLSYAHQCLLVICSLSDGFYKYKKICPQWLMSDFK